MAFSVVFDACVLYPLHLRDLLMRLARSEPEQFRAKLTQKILDEWFGAVVRNNRDQPDLPRKLRGTRRKMIRALKEDCLVTGYEDLIPSLQLPDPNDRHVLAAAIRCGAQVIVTANRRDFPLKVVQQYDVEILSPDEFVFNFLSIEPERVWTVICEMIDALSYPLSIDELLDKLKRDGLGASVAELRRRYLGPPQPQDGYAHYARAGEIARAAVYGGTVTARCGYRFQPIRDSSQFPACPRCMELAARPQ